MVSLVDTSRPFTWSSPNVSLGNDATVYYALLVKILKYVFWIVGGAGLLAVCYVLYETYTRPVSAILVFMGGVIALYFYYIKWFFTNDDRSWPTGQSLCPDYLTPVAPGFRRNFDGTIDPNQTTPFKCVDYVGVSTNGALKKMTPGTNVSTLSNPDYFVSITPAMTSKDIKAMLQERGLTWIAMFGDDN